jgi:hypothetical protein
VPSTQYILTLTLFSSTGNIQFLLVLLVLQLNLLHLDNTSKNPLAATESPFLSVLAANWTPLPRIIDLRASVEAANSRLTFSVAISLRKER